MVVMEVRNELALQVVFYSLVCEKFSVEYLTILDHETRPIK